MMLGRPVWLLKEGLRSRLLVVVVVVVVVGGGVDWRKERD